MRQNALRVILIFYSVVESCSFLFNKVVRNIAVLVSTRVIQFRQEDESISLFFKVFYSFGRENVLSKNTIKFADKSEQRCMYLSLWND